MRKFVIAIEVNLEDREADNPEIWMKNTIGSIRMRKVGTIKHQEIYGEGPLPELAQQHKDVPRHAPAHHEPVINKEEMRKLKEKRK